MLESNDENKNDCNNSYKNPLPPIVYQSDNDKEAYMKNRKEQMRLIKILDHLKIQVQVYGQLFQKEKQVVEAKKLKFKTRLQTLTSSDELKKSPLSTVAGGFQPNNVGQQTTDIQSEHAYPDLLETNEEWRGRRRRSQRHSNRTVAPLTNDRHSTYTVAPLANDRYSTYTVAPLANDQYSNYDSPVTEKKKSKQNSSEQPDVASRKTSLDKPVGACFKRTKPREAVVIRPRPSSAVAENRKRFNLPSMDYCNCLGVKKSRSANQLVAALNLENPGRNIHNACGKIIKGGGMDTFSNKPMESLKNGRCLERRRGSSLQINAERELRRELRELEEKRERRLAGKFSFARAIASENQRYRESIQRLEAFLCRVQGCPGSENSGSGGQVEPTKLSLSLNDLRSAE